MFVKRFLSELKNRMNRNVDPDIEPERDEEVRGGGGFKVAVDKERPLLDCMKELFARNGYPWEDLVIVGVRDETDISKDVFNDVLCFIVDGKMQTARATVDPGVYWTNRENRIKAGWEKRGVDGEWNGAAHLCLGRYENAYVLGTHRGYPAIVQGGAQVKLWRDIDADFVQGSEDPVMMQWAGINIHHAYSAEKIGPHAAGCQVVRSKPVFEQMYSSVKNSARLKHNPKARITYVLFDKASVPFFDRLKKEALD